MGEITVILERVRSGDARAADELLATVYDELHQLTASRMAREGPGHTLQPTALVHEVWLRLGGDSQLPWQNRAHFFGAAAEAMRRILIERARSRGRVRRGGEWERVELTEVNVAASDPDETLLALNDALEKLALKDPLKAEIVKLRYFVGMTHQETAAALELSEQTIRRHWTYARSWLYAEMVSGQQTS